MKFQLEVVYCNADSGHRDEQILNFEVDDDATKALVEACRNKTTEETLEQLFKRLYDNPNMDGSDAGIAYDTIWQVMSRRAFDKLGWHDVTVEVIGLTVDGQKFEIDTETIDTDLWALQLSREGYMYCYA